MGQGRLLVDAGRQLERVERLLRRKRHKLDLLLDAVGLRRSNDDRRRLIAGLQLIRVRKMRPKQDRLTVRRLELASTLDEHVVHGWKLNLGG